MLDSFLNYKWIRAPDKVRTFIFITFISSPNPMYDHSVESSHADDSTKWSNVGFGEEIRQVVLISQTLCMLLL